MRRRHRRCVCVEERPREEEREGRLRPRGEAPGETKPANTLVSDLHPPEPWEIRCCCLSHPACGIFTTAGATSVESVGPEFMSGPAGGPGEALWPGLSATCWPLCCVGLCRARPSNVRSRDTRSFCFRDTRVPASVAIQSPFPLSLGRPRLSGFLPPTTHVSVLFHLLCISLSYFTYWDGVNDHCSGDGQRS